MQERPDKWEELYFRDAQMLIIEEGTSEVCEIVIFGKLYHSEPESC